MWNEKKKLRRTSEQLALYLLDHRDDKSISQETKDQIGGFILSYQLTFENLELLESIMKIHLKDLETKKKKK